MLPIRRLKAQHHHSSARSPFLKVPGWISHVAVGALMALLVGLAAHHLGKGLYYLALQEPPAALADFYNRRTENAYFLDRVSPLSQYFLFEFESRHDASAEPWAIGAHGFPDGVVYAGGLPPWTYPLQFLAYIPSRLRFARLYLLSLDLMAIAGLAWLGARAVEMEGGGAAARWTAALGVLAVGAYNNTMTQGQSGLLVNGALAFALGASRHTRNVVWRLAEGAALAFAMTKPSSAVLFLLPAVLRRRYLAVATCVLVLIAATAFAAWWLRIPALVQFAQFDRASLAVVDTGANLLLQSLSAALASPKAARNVLGVLGGAIALMVSLRLHRLKLSGLLGVLAVVSRLFTYHSAYDDDLIAFLLIALGARAFGGGSTAWWKVGWMACGLTLWLPYTLYIPVAAQGLQVGCWILLAGALTLYPDHAVASPVDAVASR
jgi:hypothetical protein